MPKLQIENVLQPGKTYPVDQAKFTAMCTAVLGVLPDAPPGMTPQQVIAAVKPILTQDLFPGGAKAGWWFKAVQLDQEAKGTIRRAPAAPVRLWRVAAAPPTT